MSQYGTIKRAAEANQAARTPLPGRSPQAMSSDLSGWAGWAVFAAVMLVLIGIIHVIEGLLALLNQQYYLVGSSGLPLDIGYTAWGWVQLALGAVGLAAGASLFAGRMWARVLGTAVALLSAVAAMGFFSAYPVWGAVVIVVDVCVVLALTVHGDELGQRG